MGNHPKKGKNRKKKRNSSSVRRFFDYPTIVDTFHVAGLPAAPSRELATILLRWYASNGPQWTIDRVKAYRSWYINILGGVSEIPVWCSHTKKGLPKYPWSEVFRLPMEAAILALSVDTLIPVPPWPVKAQLDKFKHGLEGNGVDSKEATRYARMMAMGLRPRKKFHKLRPLTVATPTCITGKSIPVNATESMVIDPRKQEDRWNAYLESGRHIPQETVEFYFDQGKLDFLPIDAVGNDYQLELNTKPSIAIGTIGFIQEPEYKLRTVANPHRYTQHSLEPLFHLWREECMGLPCTTTFNKDDGVFWVQKQLRKGVTLACVDMTSATDLLDLDACLTLVNNSYFPDLKEDEYYQDLVSYFHSLSRGKWWCEKLNTFVTWKQGQPLGLTPSFMLLDMTNHALAEVACRMARIPQDSFRCHGDDMVIDARAAEHYINAVKIMGGEVNLSKTITSNTIAEFDGMVISKDSYVNKRIYLEEFSDNSFLEYASQLGPKARKYLKPRQKKVYDELKFIPGILHPGPFSRDSFGYSLAEREAWWLSVKPESLDPDLDRVRTVDENLRLLVYGLDIPKDIEDHLIPWLLDEKDYQSLDERRNYSGDPRTWFLRGRTFLQVAEEWISRPEWISFHDFSAPCALINTTNCSV